MTVEEILNLRKIKRDFPPATLKQGKELYDGNKVLSAKILHLDESSLRFSARVLGQYEKTYENEIEVNPSDSEVVYSKCGCSASCDCQHLAAALFFLEANLSKVLVDYKESGADKFVGTEKLGNRGLFEVVQEAEAQEERREEEEYKKALLDEYVAASSILATSPFFAPSQKREVESAKFVAIFHLPQREEEGIVKVELALFLPTRAKSLSIPHVRAFLEAVRDEELLSIGGKEYLFSLASFVESEREIVQFIIDHAESAPHGSDERLQKTGHFDMKMFGMLLSKGRDIALKHLGKKGWRDDHLPTLPCFFEGSLDSPIRFSKQHAQVEFSLEYMPPPAVKILLNPTLSLNGKSMPLEEVYFFECVTPGIVHEGIYYRFPSYLTRQHLKGLRRIRNMTIPEPLFGTFVEEALPELSHFSKVKRREVVESLTTIPYVDTPQAICDLVYDHGQLEATLTFSYDGRLIPSSFQNLTIENLHSFITDEGIVARCLVAERRLIENLFRDFTFDPGSQSYVARSEKKIIEFMTLVIPQYQHCVTFHAPQHLRDRFIYDKSFFKVAFSHTRRIDSYEILFEVDGALEGIAVDSLWDCVISNRSYLEIDLEPGGEKKRGRGWNKSNMTAKILILDLDKIKEFVHLCDELKIDSLENCRLVRPLWSLVNIDGSDFQKMPVAFSMTPKLREIRGQMLGEKQVKFSPIPEEIRADLRDYQREGVKWLERLRLMYLNGILADDMGLGKTLQVIVALTQYFRAKRREKSKPALVVCPTSLLYNWREECYKFNPQLAVILIEGVPEKRKKLIQNVGQYDLVITSYSLLQKDIHAYKGQTFSYMILDEAQHIKNRGTRNAQSVKRIASEHRVVLSGTPIENSLDELWSLFDFLMPEFLGTYNRFVERYVRVSGLELKKNLEYLREKISPFVLRRMKSDVLHDLPPVDENVYYTQLSQTQRDLYTSYAKSARDELTKLVERDGFERVQIHVLATLTRLKQICCHPAIFIKDKVEKGDSAKYDMLLELLGTLIEGNHRTVIFSQYAQMLQIMKEDFEARGLRFSYLDGSIGNRLEIVREFNEDASIPVFLVSLKAGGTGLNFVGADTVIHYDMWWNLSVENQATDRVHRIGQKRSVSVYKLVTLDTIEEKIIEMQHRKAGLVKQIVNCDEEAITKLTWQEILELLQT